MTEQWIALSVAIGGWVWLWPIGAIFAAAALRYIEHLILHDPKPMIGPRERFLVELLSVTSQVAIVAAGFGFAALWTGR